MRVRARRIDSDSLDRPGKPNRMMVRLRVRMIVVRRALLRVRRPRKRLVQAHVRSGGVNRNTGKRLRKAGVQPVRKAGQLPVIPVRQVRNGGPERGGT